MSRKPTQRAIRFQDRAIVDESGRIWEKFDSVNADSIDARRMRDGFREAKRRFRHSFMEYSELPVEEALRILELVINREADFTINYFGCSSAFIAVLDEIHH